MGGLLNYSGFPEFLSHMTPMKTQCLFHVPCSCQFDSPLLVILLTPITFVDFFGRVPIIRRPSISWPIRGCQNFEKGPDLSPYPQRKLPACVRTSEFWNATKTKLLLLFALPWEIWALDSQRFPNLKDPCKIPIDRNDIVWVQSKLLAWRL